MSSLSVHGLLYNIWASSSSCGILRVDLIAFTLLYQLQRRYFDRWIIDRSLSAKWVKDLTKGVGVEVRRSGAQTVTSRTVNVHVFTSLSQSIYIYGLIVACTRDRHVTYVCRNICNIAVNVVSFIKLSLQTTELCCELNNICHLSHSWNSFVISL